MFHDQNIFETYPNLNSHYKRMQNLPGVKEYLSSDRYNYKFVIYGPSKWNSDSSLWSTFKMNIDIA